MSALLAEREVKLQGGGTARVVWLAPAHAEQLAEVLPSKVAPRDLRVLSGESRAQVRVCADYAVVRATEVEMPDRREQRFLPLSMLALDGTLYVIAPKEAQSVQRMIARAEEGARGSFDLFFLLWDDLVERFHEQSEAAVAAAEKVSERVLIGPKRGLSHATYRVRRHTFLIRLAVARAHAAFAVLATERPEQWGEEASARLQELRERITALLDEVESVREALGETVEAYSSVQANDMNQVMQVLTIVSLLFLPPTLVASIYGMNFHIPEYAWPHGYAYALALMFVLTAAFLVWARLRRLIR
ncbi:MAG: hypothetical protein M0Z66_12330 [Thermaerobacter sp.]|nr:hypothetical protein [Thermaerobacter sp.]